MKALIFAAGLGTRLRPLTDNRPKALVEVGGATMLDRVINRLIDAHIHTIVVNVHHFAQKIVDHIRSNNYDADILISDEREELLDTGGGIVFAQHFLSGDQPILIHNADILTNFSITDMVERHRQSRADASLLVASRKTSRYFLFNNQNRLSGWTNISTGQTRPDLIANKTNDYQKLAFGGVHIISPSLIGEIADYGNKIGKKKFSITDFYIDTCSRLDHRAYIPSHDYIWHDVGKIDSLKAAAADIAAHRL